MIGSKYNRWTVLSLSRMSGRKAFYLCRCDCGTEREVRKDQLTRGVSKSCGCLKAEVASEQIKRLSTTHGMSNKTRTYGIWKGMRKRCHCKTDRAFKYYGARGITVCDRWNDYSLFLEDMGECPKGHSIDRINNKGNYEPGNCRWATNVQQMRNMSSNLLFRFQGETLTLKEWCERVDIPYQRVYQRIFKLGWPAKKALFSQV